MKKQRIEQLQQMLGESPHDPFVLYALACEYKEGDLETAWGYFERLLTDHPAYLPTYYHAAATAWAKSDLATAEAVYQKGIALAQQQQDRHALRELQQAYQMFQLEQD